MVSDEEREVSELAFILKAMVGLKGGLDWRLARAVLSDVSESFIDDIEFRVICTSLVDRGILKPLMSDQVLLAWEDDGQEIASSYSKNNSDEVQRHIIGLVNEYKALPDKGRNEFLKSLLMNIPSESPITVRRATPADPGLFNTNVIVIDIERKSDMFNIAKYKVHDTDRLFYEWNIYKVKYKFIKEMALMPPQWITGWIESDDSYAIVSSRELPDSAPYYYARSVAYEKGAHYLPADRVQFIEKEVIIEAMREAADSQGWSKEQFNQVFFNFSDRTRIKQKGIWFTQYPTMTVELNRIQTSDGSSSRSSYALVADPGFHQRITIFDWIDSGLQMSTISELTDETEEEYPFSILPDIGPCSIEEPIEKIYVSSPREEITVNPKYRKGPIKVESGLIAFNQDMLKKAFGGFPSRPRTSMKPPQRLSLTRDWLNRLFPMNFNMEGFKISVRDLSPSLEILSSIPDKNVLWQLIPPKLTFNKSRQQKDTTMDPRSIFRYGPLDGPRTVHVAACAVPSSFSKGEMETFLSILSDVSMTARLTRLDTANCTKIIYDERNLDRLKTGIQSLPSPGEEREIILVIGRPTARKVYRASKDLAASVAERPCQFCKVSTARRIAKGSRMTAKLFALQMFIKTLRAGECPWKLAETVSKKRTLFIGVGYSRKPGTKEEYTSYASLSLSDGTDIHWRPLDFPVRPRRYLDPEMVDAFVDFLKVESARHPEIERIVLLRRGDVYPNEISSIEEKLQEAKVAWEFDFVGVTDSNIRIFKNAEPPENPGAGLLMLIGDDRCLISMSALPNVDVPEGSVRLLELNRAIGSTSISEIGREVYDQSFLCWGSPSKPPKAPLPLVLAEKVSGLELNVTRQEVFRFFPL